MFGSTLEMDWGSNRFLELYFFGAAGGAITTILVSYLGTASVLSFLQISPHTPTIGASGAIFAVMVAFALLHGNQEFMMFPLPFTIRAKYLVGIYIFVAAAYALQGGGGVAEFAHLGGAFFGWVFVRHMPRRGLGVSEYFFGWRNAYYRWKRRRAARKFEVYMRRHDRDQYFDQYGNYRDPDDPGKSGKGNGEQRGGPWVH